jgi:competence protein ComEC
MNARLLPLLGLLLATACKEPPPPPPTPPVTPRPTSAARFLGAPADGKLHVYFLDVGQGDSALIVSPEGRTVLVDTGPASAVNHLVNRLPDLLAARLDLVVLTHPAPDHYGALEAIQKVADPRRLLEPQLPESSSEYDALLTTIASRGVEILSPAPNPSQPEELMKVPLGGGAELTVLWPRAPNVPLIPVKGAMHQANSIVLRLTHGETSVLFAGDARSETEAELLKRKATLHATLLKVGVHGADTATSGELLRKVRPRAAIISVGAGNSLGAPAGKVLERLKAAETRVFRTDKDGEVHAVSDGKQFVLTTQRLAAGESPNIQHVFQPVEEQSPDLLLALEPEATPPEPVKVVPAKATASPKKGNDIDLSQYTVVEVDPKGTSRSPAKVEKGTKALAGGELYYASKKKEIFHKATCNAVKLMKDENKVTYHSREAAMREKKPAGCCKP